MTNLRIQFLAIILTTIGLTGGSVAYCHKVFAPADDVKSMHTKIDEIRFGMCILANRSKTLAQVEACRK